MIGSPTGHFAVSVPVSDVINNLKSRFPGISNTRIGTLIRLCFPNCKRQKYSRGPYHYYGIQEKRKTTTSNSSQVAKPSKTVGTQMKSLIPIPPSFNVTKKEIDTTLKTIIDDIGHGSFGTVSVCKFRGNTIAVKTYIDRNFSTSKINREALTLLNIKSHSSIPALYGICIEKRMLLMQFCGYHDRSITIWKLIKNGSKIDYNEWNIFFREIFGAIRHIHSSGYLHNDIKEDNVLIYKNDNNIRVPSLTDFSESCLITKSKKVKYRTFHKHIPAAVLKGDEAHSVHSDIYSFVILMKTVLESIQNESDEKLDLIESMLKLNKHFNYNDVTTLIN